MRFQNYGRFLAAGVLALALASPAFAQDQEKVDPDIAAKLRAIGPVVKVPEAAKLFLPMQEKAPKDGVKHIDDLAWSRPTAKARCLRADRAAGEADARVYLYPRRRFHARRQD